MYLQIPYLVWSKVNYFLNKFPSEEWSGPAWYKPILKKDELYPVGFELIHFHPVDLGHGTATTIEAGDTAKILSKTWKNYPETEKAMMGIIHSHHTMGAFLSGTDKDTAKDQAVKDGIFFSTVVASSGEPFDCCLTYKDQFGFTNLVEGEVITPVIKVDIPQEWKQEATKIEKAKKKENKITYVNSGTNQISAFGGYHGGYGWRGVHGQTAPVATAEKNLKTETEAYNQSFAWDLQTEVDQKEVDKMDELHEQFTANEMTYHDFIEEARKQCPNIDPHMYIDALGRNFY